MHSICNLLPSCNLVRVPYPRDVAKTSGCRSNKRSFRNEKCARDGGTLRVVFSDKRKGDMKVVGAEAGEGRHDNAVLELDIADAEGLEEFRHICCVEWYREERW